MLFFFILQAGKMCILYKYGSDFRAPVDFFNYI